MDRIKLQKCYGRLKGLKDIVSSDNMIIIDLINDYNSVVDEVQKNIEEDLESYKSKKYGEVYGNDQIFSYYLKDKANIIIIATAVFITFQGLSP